MLRTPVAILARMLRKPVAELEAIMADMERGCIAFTECSHCDTPVLCGRECGWDAPEADTPARADDLAAEAASAPPHPLCKTPDLCRHTQVCMDFQHCYSTTWPLASHTTQPQGTQPTVRSGTSA